MEKTDKQAMEKMVLNFFEQRRSDRGDGFATATEWEAIKEDPMAWLSMLRGYDAYEFVAATYYRPEGGWVSPEAQAAENAAMNDQEVS